jgi:glycosyltransferase involved in cell wall biosynthesis
MKISNPLSDPDRLLPRAVSRGAVGLVAADVDVFVAMSPALAAEARKELPSARIAVIAEPNLDGRDPLPSRPEGADLMVAAGRFVPQKDFGLLVRAVATLAADAPRVVLLGEGPERPRIERLIRRLRLDDRVECAGLVADIRPWLDRARLFLLPSRYEGFPAVVVEALARGVPVVATDCSPALHELITGPDFGEIVRGRSPEAFAAAVARQLARPRPAPEKLMAQVAGNRLDASAAAYLRLFDTLSAAAMPMVAAERVAA